MIRVRGYELDRDAAVPPAVLLRYMEHLRWATLESSGRVDLSRLFQGGQRLVVVAQQLRLERELGLGQQVAGTLSLGRVGRSSMDFLHRFVADDQAVVARGSVTVVFLDQAGRSTPLPDELRAEADPDAARPQLAPGLVGEAPPGAWTMHREVLPSELDLLRHVNHANYLSYAEDARILAAAERAEIPGGRPRAVALDYRKQAVLGDRLQLVVWSAAPGEAGVNIVRGEQEVCRVRVEAS